MESDVFRCVNREGFSLPLETTGANSGYSDTSGKGKVCLNLLTRHLIKKVLRHCMKNDIKNSRPKPRAKNARLHVAT